MAGSGTAHLRDGGVLLRAEHLVVEFGSGRQRVRAVSDVSFDVAAGETMGLVGESGCGKSTTGRAAALIQAPSAGTVRFDGTDLTSLSSRELRKARTKVQMVFQDPISSLNPRRRVLDAVTDPLALWKIGTKEERIAKARDTLEAVGIDADDARSRRPIEMSGGQCQRVSIARALMLDPSVLICDEPVSALDVSVQAQILNLLDELKRERGLTMVFIAHDLAVVKNVSDRVAVMYLGKLCEVAPPETLYRSPEHPYTDALLASIPEPDPHAASDEWAPLTGDLPSPVNPPSGCRFRTRCPLAQQKCADEEPQMRAVGPDHFVACHFPLGTLAGSTDGARREGSMSPIAAADLGNALGVGDAVGVGDLPVTRQSSAAMSPSLPAPPPPQSSPQSSPPHSPPPGAQAAGPWVVPPEPVAPGLAPSPPSASPSVPASPSPSARPSPSAPPRSPAPPPSAAPHPPATAPTPPQQPLPPPPAAPHPPATAPTPPQPPRPPPPASEGPDDEDDGRPRLWLDR